jgi:hypothetical protein
VGKSFVVALVVTFVSATMVLSAVFEQLSDSERDRGARR